MRKRMRLPRKATERMAQIAYERGISAGQTTGKLFSWMTEKQNNHENGQIKVYGQFLYVYQGERLITVYNIPTGLYSVARKNQKKRRRVAAG